MCGITVFYSNKNIVQNIINSLELIQNRGYDSIGISIKEEDNWNTYKYIKNNNNTQIEIMKKELKDKTSRIGIGHTRWATHGGVTIDNCHPHYSMNKRIILVHNGIINNYQEIKKLLQSNGYKFYSQTDSEVIANLIEYNIDNNLDNNLKTAIELTIQMLNGTWALAIIDTLSDNIYLTRNGSPLILGSNEEMIISTSETTGLMGLINNYIVLDSDDIVCIGKDGYKTNKTYKINTLLQDDIVTTPSPYLYWTIKEIYDQPTSILAAFNYGGRILNNNIELGGLRLLENILKENNRFDHLLLFGCGTSYHATLLAKYYFSNSYHNNFKTIQSFDASEFDEYDLPIVGESICIFCSQSGETYDIIRCIDICKKKNYYLIGITNVVESYIARSVNCGVYMNAGKEIAVASTKSFTSTLIILSLIGMWFKNKFNNTKKLTCLRCLPDNINNLLENKEYKESVNKICNNIVFKNIENLFILGTEKLYPIAKEVALKIKEITYIHAEAYPCGSLKHGPFSLLDNKTLTIMLIQNKRTDKLLSTFNEITARDTNCLIVTDNKDLILENTDILYIPKMEYYEEIMFTVGLQYFSYILSIKREINPDKPRNLAKVVTVE